MRFPLGGRDLSRPVGAARFRRSPATFPPESGGVSAGYRGVPPEGGRRAAVRSQRGRPDRPGAGARRRPLPSHVIHFADGRT
jgi:hypothetical protein